MTKEEAISLLKQINKILINSNSWLENTHEPLNQAFDMAIKALEQQTSVDCVSRAEVIYELNRLGRNAFKDDTDYDNFFAFVDSLPPVTPTRKVGKWIYKKLGVRTFGIVCSSCNRVYHEGQNIGSLEEFKKDIERIMRERNVTLDEYCCHCGTEMVGAENERV